MVIKNNKLKFIFLLLIFVTIVILVYPVVLFYFYKYRIIDILTSYSPLTIKKAFQYHSPYAMKSLVISSIIAIIFESFLYLFTLKKTNSNIHGEARFANDNEVKKYINEKKGIIIGMYKNKILRFSGQQFVSLGAPTRSGKGVGIVVPNLLEQEDSMVVLDVPKKEAFTISSRYRKDILKQKVYLISPFSKISSKYNPLDYVSFKDGLHEVQLNSIAHIIYVGRDENDFFLNQAKELFVGFAIFIHDLIKADLIDKSFSIATILECSTMIEGMPFENYYSMVKAQNFEKLTHSGVLRIERFLSTSDNTRSSIKSSFETPLAIFGVGVVAENTNSSDFDLNDLRKKKMTVYLSVTLQELIQGRALINLFFSQLLSENTKKLPEQDSSLKYPCILLLDEFTSIGQIEILKKGSAFIAGYNLRMITIYQSLSQLEEPIPAGYGKEGAKSLLTNHACQIVYAPKELSDAEEYSKRLGYRDVIDNSISRSSKGVGKQMSENKQKRALMLPQELQTMPSSDEIIFMENSFPIKCKKAFYFSNDYFINKLKMVSPYLRSIAKPEKKDFDKAFQMGETSITFEELGK